MTKTSMNLAELLEKHDEGDFLRAVAEAGLAGVKLVSSLTRTPD